GGNAMGLDQGNQGSRNEQLIGNGIEQHSNRGDLSPAPGQVPIQQISGGGDQENGQRQEFVAHQNDAVPFNPQVLFHQHGHQEWNEKDPKNGERGRQIHRAGH